MRTFFQLSCKGLTNRFRSCSKNWRENYKKGNWQNNPSNKIPIISKPINKNNTDIRCKSNLYRKKCNNFLQIKKESVRKNSTCKNFLTKSISWNFRLIKKNPKKMICSIIEGKFKNKKKRWEKSEKFKSNVKSSKIITDNNVKGKSSQSFKVSKINKSKICHKPIN